MKKNNKITYAQVGDNYLIKDPVNKLSQQAAKSTGINLKKAGFNEIQATRGESAFVWKQGPFLMASVIECLGTKSLVADEMRKIADPEQSRRTYYDVIANNTVATFINDLSSVGAKPSVVHAYWAFGDNDWLEDKKRLRDFIKGWKQACDESGATWGGGETATLKGILNPDACDLAGSVVGIIKNPKNLVIDKKLRTGDRIIFVKSNGVNANGISLARRIAKKLPQGYVTKMPNGALYGEAILTKSNLYAKLIQSLIQAEIDIHYITHITGHGLRKIMRGRQNFTYVIEKLFQPQEVFKFIQKHAGLNDYEAYETYNMGQDYAIFLPAKDVKKAEAIIKKNGFESLDAGYLKKGPRQVVIKPKNVIYFANTLDIR